MTESDQSAEQHKHPTNSEIWRLFKLILQPDKRFYSLAIIYGIAISLLTLAIPISVQSLIGSVANTMLPTPIITLATVLLIVLLISSLLYALQYYILELFERRFYARITSEITLRSIMADNTYYESINRDELTNRYFEIMTVQKCLPQLIAGGFALILQAAVGFILVSFYHPALLAFNGIFILCAVIIWRVWTRKAMVGAFEVSDCKYDTVRWLEELARTNNLFKSERNAVFAIEKSEYLTSAYVASRRRYFKSYFSQTLGFLLLYAFASAALLGLGGMLVIQEQLTLGQLVAAELVLSAIFYGASRFGYYLQLYYELCAAINKIGYFFKIPLEDRSGDRALPEGPFDIEMQKATYCYRGRNLQFDVAIPAGQNLMIAASSSSLERLFIDLLKRYRLAQTGMVRLGEFDVRDCESGSVRDRIIAIHSTSMMEATIKQFMHFGAPDATHVEIMGALARVELVDTVERLELGLETPLTPSGYPLSQSELIRLKLARALLSKPSVLILTHLFDIVAYRKRQRIVKRLLNLDDITFIYISKQYDMPDFSHYLFLNWKSSHYFETQEALQQFEISQGEQSDEESL